MDDRAWGNSRSRLPSINTTWSEAGNESTARSSRWSHHSLPPIINIPPFHNVSSSDQRSVPRTTLQTLLFEETDPKGPKLEHNDIRLSTVAPFTRTTLYKPTSVRRQPSGSETAYTRRENEARELEKGNSSLSATPPSDFCWRCKRLVKNRTCASAVNSSLNEIGANNIDRSEVTHVTQTAAVELTKILNTLNLGLRTVRQGSNHHANSASPQEIPDSPTTGSSGLTRDLDAVLHKISRVNELAKELVRQILNTSTHDQMWQGPDNTNEARSSRKRPVQEFDDEQDERPTDNADMLADARVFTKRRSSMTMLNRAATQQAEFQKTQPAYLSFLDGRDQQTSIMNPPPVPNRTLPSSPGKSFPSPIIGSYPQSPSAASYVSNASTALMHAGHESLASSNTSYLPSIASYSSDNALQAHTAALQHEVSVQKIALSSLQSEHDKLLAALSRSQTRASALEKKHSVSDNEIVNLTEEKLRLQTQVQELEKDVEDLTHSRDEARKSAVQEANQYVDIVRKATQLEKLAAEERRSWTLLKAKMEERIESLTTRTSRFDDNHFPSAAELQDKDRATTAPISDMMKLDEPETLGSEGLHSLGGKQESTQQLRAEMDRLRKRCAQVEGILKSIREESQSVEGIVRLLEITRKSIQEKTDQALRSTSLDI